MGMKGFMGEEIVARLPHLKKLRSHREGAKGAKDSHLLFFAFLASWRFKLALFSDVTVGKLEAGVGSLKLAVWDLAIGVWDL